MDLQELGRKTAGAEQAQGRYPGRRAAREVLKAVERIEETRRRLTQKSCQRLPTAVEWLLDNAYLAKREGASAWEELKRGKRLRRQGERSYVQQAAYVFGRAAPAAGQEELSAYLAGLQEEGALTEEELSLFIPALKGELCRLLAERCSILETDPEKPGLAEEMEGIFTGLRTLSVANLGPLLEESSPVEQTLRRDPAELYGRMDEATRARYRRQVCLLARRHGLGEEEAAEKALALAREGKGQERHIGWFLFRRPWSGRSGSPRGSFTWG